VVLFASIAQAGGLRTYADGTFYTTDVSSIPKSGEYTTASSSVRVPYAEKMFVQYYGITQSTAATGRTIVTFVFSTDGSTWDTEASTQVYCVITSTISTSPTRGSKIIDVYGVESVRISKIENTDTSYDTLNFNVRYGYAE